MRRKLPLLFLAVLCVFLLTSAAVCTAEHQKDLPYRFHTEWAKLSAVDGRKLVPPTDRNVPMAVLWLIPEPGYYTYANDPGAEGMALRVSVIAGGRVLTQDEVQIRYTPGTEHRLEDGSISRHLYRMAPVFLLFKEDIREAATLDVSLLACSSQHCLPVNTRILLPAPPPDLRNASQFPWFEELGTSRTASSVGPAPAVTAARPDIREELPAELASLLPEAPTSVFQKRIHAPASAVPMPEPGKETGYGFQPQMLEGAFQIDGWLRAIGIGIIAGLLLNFMPCVLPVLTMKLSSLLSVEESPEARRRALREHNLFFAGGIVIWFALLAVISGLTGMLWGQLFQSSVFIFLMLLIVFCMGLSMFDVFHLPVLDLQPQHRTSPRMQAFTTGLFTTLLATPCSGPLLGGVLAWGITKPLAVLVTIFMATGIGMALPYLMLAAFPQLMRFLPRPGAWLAVLERILGFLLMATAIYLFSILPPSLHVKTLITLLVASVSAWIWGRWGSLRGSVTRRMFLGAFACGAIFLCGFWAFLPAQKEVVPWIAFSEKDFRADLGKKAMIVEFTADWCPTCKVLERTTLSAPNLLPILDQYSVTPVKVDMTFKDASHQALLTALDSASIPLLAIFPEGDLASKPVILRDIYTVTDLHLALRQAKIPHKRMVEMLNPIKLLSPPRE